MIRSRTRSVSVAMMMTVVTGTFAVATFYGEEPKWAPIVHMVVPLTIWSVGGVLLD